MNPNSSIKSTRSPQQTAYNPVTLANLQKPTPSALKVTLDRFRQPVSCCLALPLFAAVLFSTEDLTALVLRATRWPVPILLLIGCLFWRLDPQQRRVAAIPLSLSGLKLFCSVTDYITRIRLHPGLQPATFPPGFLWLPLFFSLCLVFVARRETATFKVTLAGSCILLASGLLPGEGFVGIFLMTEVMLFFAIIVAVFADLLPYFNITSQASPGAHPLASANLSPAAN